MICFFIYTKDENSRVCTENHYLQFFFPLFGNTFLLLLFLLFHLLSGDRAEAFLNDERNNSEYHQRTAKVINESWIGSDAEGENIRVNERSAQWNQTLDEGVQGENFARIFSWNNLGELCFGRDNAKAV